MTGKLVPLVIPILLSACATTISGHSSQYAGNTMRSNKECDSLVNGALIGTAIGASPLLGLVIPPNDESDTRYLFAGEVGAIVGFWVGLAVDGAHCHKQEASFQD